MLIGYARVSTDDQNLDLQRDALQKACCDKIHTDRQSGVSADRSGLATVLEVARAGDTLVIWRLDRLGRSLKGLIHLVEKLERQGVGLKSLQEDIDTTTSGGTSAFSQLSKSVMNQLRPSVQTRRYPPVSPFIQLERSIHFFISLGRFLYHGTYSLKWPLDSVL